jgi:16S rRNA (cytidine1402-2'-O)-methyltransferase
MTGVLYVVATPIGNLKDITFRAVEVLTEVDLIACEDTRLTKRLLDHYNIGTKTISYHQHSNNSKIKQIVDLLKKGESVALVSDAGTPGISDPGGMLVEVASQAGIKVVGLPGPSAVITALSVSGFPTDRFLFMGFLPHKKGRETIIKEMTISRQTVVFYESVHRITKALQQMIDIGIQREVVVCRELTKQFEAIYRGSPVEVLSQLNADVTKGEFVVVVSPNKDKN